MKDLEKRVRAAIPDGVFYAKTYKEGKNAEKLCISLGIVIRIVTPRKRILTAGPMFKGRK